MSKRNAKLERPKLLCPSKWHFMRGEPFPRPQHARSGLQQAVSPPAFLLIQDFEKWVSFGYEMDTPYGRDKCQAG
jgi:hypothetical protein